MIDRVVRTFSIRDILDGWGIGLVNKIFRQCGFIGTWADGAKRNAIQSALDGRVRQMLQPMNKYLEALAASQRATPIRRPESHTDSDISPAPAAARAVLEQPSGQQGSGPAASPHLSRGASPGTPLDYESGIDGSYRRSQTPFEGEGLPIRGAKHDYVFADDCSSQHRITFEKRRGTFGQKERSGIKSLEASIDKLFNADCSRFSDGPRSFRATLKALIQNFMRKYPQVVVSVTRLTGEEVSD